MTTMRNSNRSLLAVTAMTAALAIGAAACNGGSGDVNAHNINVTVSIAKTVVSSASGIGVVYVGVWSGVDNRLGFTSPVAAPVVSAAGADTFPYGGSSIGGFETRDGRVVCQKVTSQNVVDKGTHFELTVPILQFPWVKGQVVWAFTDRYDATLYGNTLKTAFHTCDPDNGFTDYFGIPIQITSITAGAPIGSTASWNVSFAATQMTNGSGTNYFQASKPMQILDGAGHYFDVVPNSLDTTTFSMVVTTPVGTSLVPKATGATPTRLQKNDPADSSAVVSYGTQFQDILNFPAKYLQTGDFIVSTPATLNSPSDVTITLDATVP
jgi:hypothetical protein